MGLFLLQSICLLQVKDMKTIPLTLTALPVLLKYGVAILLLVGRWVIGPPL